MVILITGASGYIGSHVFIELSNAGFECVGLDNFANSKKGCLERIQKIVQSPVHIHEVDLTDYDKLLTVFNQNKIEVVVHLAGLKAVGESCAKPLLYYENNILGSINLLKAMAQNSIDKIIFSSSATVYGDPMSLPISESSPVGKCSNPYGKTKYFIEEILRDTAKAHNIKVIALRYFNPVGAYESGTIGEDPNGIPNNLVPIIVQVATGKIQKLKVFGGDYQTKDGTAIRDYIHVVDLAKGHVSAVRSILDDSNSTLFTVYNLGTGQGYTVLEMIKTFEKKCGREIPYEIVGRRDGDCGVVYADPQLAKLELKWEAQYDLEKMCEDTWKWCKFNQTG